MRGQTSSSSNSPTQRWQRPKRRSRNCERTLTTNSCRRPRESTQAVEVADGESREEAGQLSPRPDGILVEKDVKWLKPSRRLLLWWLYFLLKRQVSRPDTACPADTA